MLFTRIASLIALSAAALAYTVPSGTLDGTYQVYIDKDGSQVHEPLDQINDTTVAVTVNRKNRFNLRGISPGDGLGYFEPKEYRCGCA